MNQVIRETKEKDRCVVCGKKTPYYKNTPINARMYYVEGSGQLCGNCWKIIFKENR
jgi:recombinational DNA repair protein (RecF pathway)